MVTHGWMNKKNTVPFSCIMVLKGKYEYAKISISASKCHKPWRFKIGNRPLNSEYLIICLLGLCGTPNRFLEKTSTQANRMASKYTEKNKAEHISKSDTSETHKKREGGRGETTGGQQWRSITLTKSVSWQASASRNNLEIISIHKGPAVWRGKRSLADRSLRFRQLPLSLCTGLTSILAHSPPASVGRRRRMKKWDRVKLAVPN